uniref:Uncharacterized protein n=1 Tax=Picea sitchensis TaxID=3332 RepID=A9NX12_PICSI|nr:unknown [Picea sitchensis]
MLKYNKQANHFDYFVFVQDIKRLKHHITFTRSSSTYYHINKEDLKI